MGFSVSGSTALIFVGLLIALSTLIPATLNAYDEIQEAEKEQFDKKIEASNTAVKITSVQNKSTTVVVKAKNTGTHPLDVEDVDLLIKNTYVSFSHDVVEADSSTMIWASKETINMTVQKSEFDGVDPVRAKVIVEYGKSDTEVF
jgi:flagellar protein FlaF